MARAGGPAGVFGRRAFGSETLALIVRSIGARSSRAGMAGEPSASSGPGRFGSGSAEGSPLSAAEELRGTRSRPRRPGSQECEGPKARPIDFAPRVAMIVPWPDVWA